MYLQRMQTPTTSVIYLTARMSVCLKLLCFNALSTIPEKDPTNFEDSPQTPNQTKMASESTFPDRISTKS